MKASREKQNHITLDDVLEIHSKISYNIDTGKMYWKGKYNGRAPKGSECGSIRSDGYRIIQVNNRNYLAHQLVWILFNFEYPKYQIDHINGNRQDNRIENLRDVPALVNNKNAKKHKHNTSGIMGVGWHKKSGKWRAYIKVAGRQIELGLSGCFFEACCLRKSAEVFYGFSRRHGEDT